MTRQEFALFAAAIKTYYSKEEKLIPNEQAMELWYRQLMDIPYKIAEAALHKWVATNKWSPSIAEIREMAVSIKFGDTPTWADGWEEVRKAIQKYGYYKQAEAMEYLSEIPRECVKRMGFVNLCLSTNEAADRANFRMIYETISNRKRVDAQLPSTLADTIEKIQSETKRLELGDHEQS